MEKEKMEKYDKINLLWIFEKASLGNLIRLGTVVVKIAEKIIVQTKKCIDNTTTIVKTEIQKEKKTVEETKNAEPPKEEQKTTETKN